MLASNLHTYHRLTDESPVAELQFTAVAPQVYEVTIAYGMTETSPVSFQSSVDDPIGRTAAPGPTCVACPSS